MKKLTFVALTVTVLVGVGYLVQMSLFQVSTTGSMTEREVRRHLRCALRQESPWEKRLYEKQIPTWGNAFCMNALHRRATTAQLEKVWLKISNDPKWIFFFFFREGKAFYPPQAVYHALATKHRAQLLRVILEGFRDDSTHLKTFGKKNAIFHWLYQLDPQLKTSFDHIKLHASQYHELLENYALWFAQAHGVRPVAEVLFQLTQDCLFKPPTKAEKGKKNKTGRERCEPMLYTLNRLIGANSWWGKLKSLPATAEYKKQAEATFQFFRVFYQRERISPSSLQKSYLRTYSSPQTPTRDYKFTWKLDNKGSLKTYISLNTKDTSLEKKQSLWEELKKWFTRQHAPSKGWVLLRLSKEKFFSCTTRAWYYPSQKWFPKRKVFSFANMSEDLFCGKDQRAPFLRLQTYKTTSHLALVEKEHSHILVRHPQFPVYFDRSVPKEKAAPKTTNYALIGPLHPGRYEFFYRKQEYEKFFEHTLKGQEILVQQGKTIQLSIDSPLKKP